MPASGEREIRVTVVNDSKGAEDSVVKLDASIRMVSATPPEQPIAFSREDESQTGALQVERGAQHAAW